MKFKSVLCMILLCIGTMVFAEETPLNRHPEFRQFDTITVACTIGTVPFSYLDDDGQVKGSVIDLWRLWSEKTGIRINFVPASWQAVIDMVCAGKADAFALNANLEAQESCLDDVFPVLNDKAYFFWHKSISGLKTIEDLKAFRIGVIKGTPIENYFREKLPDAVLAVFPNAPSMMNALKKKEILIFANTLQIALRRLKKYGLEKEFQFDPQNSLYTITAYTGVKKGNTALAEALKQGMNLITADEQASVERKWLERASVKTEDTLVIAMSQYFPPFTFVNAEGKPAGLFVDIWKLWSEKNGQKIEFLPSTWSESIENLKNGSADIHSGLAVTPEREKWMNFSQEFYENSFYLFFPIKQGKPLSVKELSGQKVGVVENSSPEEFLRNNYPDIELVLFKSNEEAILGAKDGEVSALANSFLSTSAGIMNLGLSGEFEAGKEALYTQTFHAGTLKENKELPALIDKGFDAISDAELAEIEKRWIPDAEKRYYQPDMKKIRLTAEEQAWIKKHPKIRVESFDGYPPVGFLNQDGVFNGMNADYISLISQRTGIEMEYVFTERGMADSMIKNGKLDIIYSFNVPKRREYLNFTKPFYYAAYVIISRTDFPFISNLNALKGKKIAVAKGMRVLDRLRKDYPAIEIYHPATPLEGLQDVSFNKADIYIGTQNSTTYMIHKNHLNNLKISGTNLYENEPYMFAIRNDWHELRGIFNKAIDSISKEEHDEITQKWIPVIFEYKADWSEIWEWAGIIGSFFIIILGISLIWNRRLAKEIIKRIRAESDLKERIKELICLSAINYEMQRNSSTDDFCNSVIEHLATAMQFPEITRTVIELSGKRFSVGESEQASTHNLHAEIKGRNVIGHVWVYYAEERPFIIPEEQILIDNVAHAIKVFTERKQAEEALKQSEKQFRAMFENHNAVMLLIDPENGKIIRANTAAEKYYGYSSEQFEDMAISRINQLTEAEMAKIKAENRNYSNFAHKLANGEIRNVEVHCSPIPFMGKTIMYSIIHDITDRRRAEIALRESEERYRKAEALGHVGNWEYNIQTTRFWGSDEAKRIYGFNLSSENFSTDEVEKCIPEWERVNQALTDLIEKDKPYHLEFEIIPKHTHERRTIVSVAELEKDESGKPLKVTGVIQDITDRKRAEEELQESYQTLQSFITAVPASVFLIDTEGMVLATNSITATRLNRTVEEITSKNIFDFIPPDVAQTRRKYVEKAVHTCSPVHFEDIRNGRSIDNFINPITDPAGKVIKLAVLGIDITDRKRVEEELRKAKEIAESATQAKSRFLALMSHEIRTPMNPIINLTRLLLDTDLTAEQRDLAKTVLTSSNILNLLLNDILDLSKIEAGKMELNFTNFSLSKFLDEIVSLISGRCKEKGLWLKCHTESDVRQFLRGDPHRLRQILINFVGNAVKFTDQGGITIQVNQEKEDGTDITLKFSVTDTGIGILKDRMKHLFQSFSQADASTSRKYGGTGLGLAISKQLAEMMGGQAGAESTERKGSTFWFTAVFQKCTESEVSEIMKIPDRIAAPETQQLPPVRILVAEDNLFNQKVASMIFKKIGFDPDIVSNGKEAADALENTPYDLVFMDIQMPVMDGIEATRIIRNMKPEIRNVPIIAMTADAMEGDREKYIRQGMDDYVSKPVSPDELLACIQRQFRQHAESEAQKTADSIQVFDKEEFLGRIGGNETLGKKLIGIFLSDTPETLISLKSAAEAGDLTSAAAYAHNLKGTFGNMSASRLYADALAMENASKQNEPEKAREIMRRMEKEFAVLKQVLEKF